MSSRYKTWPQGRAYFVTMTIVDWIDLFTRREYGELLLQNLTYCVGHKQLSVWAYCVMPSHVHLLAGVPAGLRLSDVLRDLKGYTSKRLVEAVTAHPHESRRAWLLDRFQWRGRQVNQQHQVWQEGSHPLEITSEARALAARDYIHLNPERAGLVTAPPYYPMSSACATQPVPLAAW